MPAFKALLDKGPAPALVSVMLVNSETGAIQPIKEIAALAKARGALMHTDAVQAAGRIPLDIKDLGVDMMSLSAHKIGGPQGVGAMIFRETQLLPKFMRGGSQETHQRAGTQNVAGIAGFGHAVQATLNEMKDYARITALRDHLETEVRKISNEAIVYAGNVLRVGNTSNIGFPGMSSETQLMALDLEGVSVSSGSACSAGSFKPSYVLAAMGADEDDARSALRISLGWATTSADIDRFIAAWTALYTRTKKKN
jgi:cysteine desulfurase